MRTKTEGSFKKGGLSAGQKKIAAKAPPPDKIAAKDFAVLKNEKAKGRGMGLQDENVKPGKVMKARVGKSIDKKASFKTIGVFPNVSSAAGGKGSGTGGRDTRTLTEKGQFIKRRTELAGPKNITPLKVLGKVATSRAGALGAILGAGAVGLNIAGKKLKEFADKKKDKKMVGGMAKKYSNGMTDKTFTDPKTAMIAHSMKTEDKISKRDREAAKMLEKKAPKGMYSSFMEEKKAIDKVKASKKIPGRMGGGMMQRPMGGPMGGMMQRPMGYKSGTMVKARGCKLGRTRPTKMY
jgi:hypothetical protein